MIKFFKSLFSDSDIINTGVNALVRSGDALVYTDEEKAQRNERQEQWYLELMKALSPSAKSRRGVAWTVVGMVSVFSIIAIFCRLVGWHDDAKWVLELLSEVWAIPFGLVITFYFVIPGRTQGKK